MLFWNTIFLIQYCILEIKEIVLRWASSNYDFFELCRAFFDLMTQNSSGACTLAQLQWRAPTATELVTCHGSELGLTGISITGDYAVVRLSALQKFIVEAEITEADLQAENDKPCELCGDDDGPLTTTDCCGRYICDDSERMKSRWKACQVHHEKYSHCFFHFNEKHAKLFSKSWQDCVACAELGSSGDYEFEEDESRVTDEQLAQYTAEKRALAAKSKADRESAKRQRVWAVERH